MIPLLAASWLGHSYALTVVLNVIYSFAIPRKWQRGGRLLVAVLVAAFPFAAWYWYDQPLWNGYCFATAGIGGVVLPIVTLWRALRRNPPELIASSSQVVDIAKELGRRPLGFGQHWRLARLPGNQLLQVEFAEWTFRLANLPAVWDGLTILHLTDLHFHGSPEREFFERVIDLAMKPGQPDLVCLTGDYVDSVRHQQWIKPLLGRLKWREAGLAILGNHDFWCVPGGVRRRLRRAGFTVLADGWQTVTVRGLPLAVIGHEGPWFPPPTEAVPPPAGFKLCLSHTPDNLPWAAGQGVDFMLAGHVHGGQVRVPVLGSLFVPSRFSRRYDTGAFRHGSTVMYVSRGLSGREPLRWNCRPEVTRITLRAASDQTG